MTRTQTPHNAALLSSVSNATPASARRRGWLALVGGGCALALSGCAAFHTFSAQVSSFGQWPQGRAPGTYAFDRLPSQQAQAQEQEALEQLAAPALQAAGFTAAPAGTTPEVLVQVGARTERQLRSPWDDPLWVRPWGSTMRPGPWWGPHWPDASWMHTEYTREVALLIRDRASGQALYETRAQSDGSTQGDHDLFQLMFQTALKDFPNVKSDVHSVSVDRP